MKREEDIKISYWAAHLTTTVSVSLVLLLLGIIACITLSSRKETRSLQEQLEVNIVMNDTVSDSYAKSLVGLLEKYPFVLNPGFISKEEALKDWEEDTGEDLKSLFGVNPLSPEVYFRLKAEYSSTDSLKKINKRLEVLPGVSEIVMPDSEMVDSMNRNINSLAIILGIVAFVMIIISVVLINNTVHLSIYARRFIIHTMQLVGATGNFIQRPFIVNNMLAGLLASVVSIAILAISLAAAPRAGWNDVANYISWGLFACIAGGMILAGPLICGLSAYMATNKFLHKDYDDLVKS